MEYVGHPGLFSRSFLGTSLVWIPAKCVNTCICIKSMVSLILKNGVHQSNVYVCRNKLILCYSWHIYVYELLIHMTECWWCFLLSRRFPSFDWLIYWLLIYTRFKNSSLSLMLTPPDASKIYPLYSRSFISKDSLLC